MKAGDRKNNNNISVGKKKSIFNAEVSEKKTV